MILFQKQGLYYDGNTGTYYYYDVASKTYKFHSQICTNDASNLPISQNKEEQKTGKTDKVAIHKIASIYYNTYFCKYI